MPYKDLAKRRAASKAYRENNKEKEAERKKVWQEKNKEKIAEKNKAYRENNKEKIAERKKEWFQTEKGRKSNKIADWKRQGVVCENFDNLYDYIINCKNCEQCNVELTIDKRRK